MSVALTKQSIALIYEVENTPEILSFVIPKLDVLIWPMVRLHVMSMCRRTLADNGIKNPWPEHTMPFSEEAFLNILKQWPKKDIWIYSILFSAYYKSHDNRLYDYVYEPLAEVFPKDTLFLDSAMHEPFISPTAGYEVTRMDCFNQWVRKLIDDTPNAIYEPFAKKFVAFLKERLTKFNFELSSQFYNDFYYFVVWHCQLSAVRTDIYDKILQDKCPKLYLGHALMSGYHVDIVPLLKKNGVTVAEPQHSVVGKDVFYTNFASSIVHEQALKNALPDAFLTYSDYWSTKMNTPAQNIVIGNPWLTMCIEQYPYLGGDAILFALNFEYEKYIPYIENVKKKYPNREIIFRPHPSNRKKIHELKIAHLKGVTLDMTPNIFETLTRCDTVISEFSGAIYDAVCTGKRVFVLKNFVSESLDAIGFNFFTSEEELIDLLENTNAPDEDIINFYNSKNWKENYTNFIRTYVPDSHTTGFFGKLLNLIKK